MFIVETFKIDRRQLPGNSTHRSLLLNMQQVDFRSVESFLPKLSSHVYWWALFLILRPSVMVAPPFVPECITPKCLAHGNEGEATPTTTVGILPLSYIYIYGGHSPSLKDTQGAETDLKSTRSIYRAMT